MFKSQFDFKFRIISIAVCWSFMLIGFILDVGYGLVIGRDIGLASTIVLGLAAVICILGAMK